MELKTLFGKAKTSYLEYQAKQRVLRMEEQAKRQEALDAELARKNDIQAGRIEPIEVDFNFEEGEHAYALFNANRLAMVENVTATTQKQGVVGRAVLGAVLLGPLGAVAGAATAGSKTNHKTTKAMQKIDSGKFLMTNKRLIFVGNAQVVSIRLEDAVEVKFDMSMSGRTLKIKYTEMLPGEYYVLSGKDTLIADLFYQGVRQMRASAAQS